MNAEAPFNQAAFFASLMPYATTEEFQWQLRTAARLDKDAAIPFGSSLPAHRSVVSAMCCFARSPDSMLDAIAKAVALGDDTDTLAGMAAALVGARCGLAAVPSEYADRLEDGEQGRQHILHLAEQLHAVWEQDYGIVG